MFYISIVYAVLSLIRETNCELGSHKYEELPKGQITSHEHIVFEMNFNKISLVTVCVTYLVPLNCECKFCKFSAEYENAYF